MADIRYKDHTPLSGAIAAGDLFPMDELVSGSTYQTRSATGAQVKTWAQSGLAAVATSGSATDLSAGTLPLARLVGITTAELSAAAGITNAQLAGSIDLSKLAITGTPDGTKFLRDSGSWQNVTWAQVDKTTSSLADITTRSASDLSSGTLPDARFPATLPVASGVNLTALNASNLASGTVAAARGGAGAVSGILKANGAGLVSAVTIGSNLTFDGTTLNVSVGGFGSTGFSAASAYDPVSVLNGEIEFIDVTLPGASVGDLAVASFTVALPGGMFIAGAQVIATNTVRVNVVNHTGSTQDIASGTLKVSTLGTGSGDTVGPGSATDNAIARFDSTTGKLIQNSAVTIADTSGNMAGVGTLNTHTIPGGTDTFALMAASQTLTNKTISGASNTLSNIGNSSLTNSSVTIGSTSVSLGATAATVAGLTLTTPTIASFTNATHDHSNAAGGGTLNASAIAAGTLALARGGTGASLSDPGGHRLMAWDDTDNAVSFVTIGSGLTYTQATHTLSASGGGGGGDALVANPLSQFASTTSAQFAGVLSDETGFSSGALAVFSKTPTIETPSFTTGFTIGGVAATGTIPRGNGTNFVASAFTLAAPGTSGNVLTSDGTNWLSSAPSGGGGSQTPWTANVDADGFNLLFDDSTGIKSSESGNANLLLFTSAASGVNYFTIANGASGTSPKLSSNVGIDIQPASGSTSRLLMDRFGTKFEILNTFDSNQILARLTPQYASLQWEMPIAASELQYRADGGAMVRSNSTIRWAYEAISPTQITANQNNYAAAGGSGVSPFVRLTSDAARDITGIVAGNSGEFHWLINVGSNSITLKHQDTNSTAANRFIGIGAADVVLAADEKAMVVYDATTARWRVMFKQ